MKRKDYRKPTMMVVKVQQLLPLMQSGIKGERKDYGAANKDVSISSEEKKNGIWEWN